MNAFVPDARTAGLLSAVRAPRRRNGWDVAATILLIALSAPVAISLATLFVFVVAWGSYGASMTGDQSWIGMAVVLGIGVLGCVAGMIWSAMRLVRRRTAFWVMLAPIVVGLLIVAGFGMASGDVSNVFAWLFPWGYL